METGAALFQAASSPRVRVLKHLNNQKTKLLGATQARTLLAVNTADDDEDAELKQA